MEASKEESEGGAHQADGTTVAAGAESAVASAVTSMSSLEAAMASSVAMTVASKELRSHSTEAPKQTPPPSAGRKKRDHLPEPEEEDDNVGSGMPVGGWARRTRGCLFKAVEDEKAAKAPARTDLRPRSSPSPPGSSSQGSMRY
uniref:Uncharacterized protein n=1 Tax=Hemiselmis andersenii TaxID=464988 RepID=A0A6T8KJW9_HEMAN|mmetsp:Transcript_34367/g.83653  ORF Transcript_34367/g.83653 Transcript_34367/m.83653 type:complete len:144 (+) Transcript_34367:102-533(+)